ncbi:MAG: pseudouridine synthase [Solirubrobacteraceae bacterium]|nr:pseudouridine synthase [Solirubrobacteraceae bacterium]
MRLAKYLAHAGVASRRAAEDLIVQGRVHVGRSLITTPVFFVEPGQKVYVDGELVGTLEDDRQLVVYALNKPVGVVSTSYDPQGRPTVTEFAPPEAGRVYPVGRLDIDSSGLLLITNDGDLAHKLTHPSFEVPKTYEVRIAHPPISRRDVETLRRGVELDDGWTMPAEAEQHGPAHFAITLREGRNRQVRRMCEAIGHPVKDLQRVRFGTLDLGHLHEGDVRRLKAQEVDSLRKLAEAAKAEDQSAEKGDWIREKGQGGRRAQAKRSAEKQAEQQRNRDERMRRRD